MVKLVEFNPFGFNLENKRMPLSHHLLRLTSEFVAIRKIKKLPLQVVPAIHLLPPESH